MKKLIIFIHLLISAIALDFTFLACQESREIRKTINMDENGRLSIDTYKGSIAIEAWNKPVVEIVARIEADGRGRGEREKVDDTEILIHSSGDGIKIKTDYADVEHRVFSFFGLFDNNGGNLPFVHYSISMPATARLNIKDYKSETTVRGIKSSIRVDTYKGKVDIDDVESTVDLETYKGDVRIEYDMYEGNSRFETYKGKIHIAMPEASRFHLDADIGRKGDFDSDFEINVKRKSRGSGLYRAEVNGGGPLLQISTEKGDIRLRAK